MTSEPPQWAQPDPWAPDLGAQGLEPTEPSAGRSSVVEPSEPLGGRPPVVEPSEPLGEDVSRPPGSWRGDVHAGVDAWTRGRDRVVEPSEPRDGRRQVVEPSEPLGEDVSRPTHTGRRTHSAGGRRSARSRRPAPPDPAHTSPEADPESVARTILLDQLTGRARSRRELADKLASKDVPSEVATRLLDRFEEVGLVDDDAFARTWVSGRQQAKGLARRALAQELRRKGVDDDVARAALDDLDPAEEEQAARQLVRRKLRTLSRVDDLTATRRLVGMLARKGYGSGLAFSVVRDELASAGREAPDA